MMKLGVSVTYSKVVNNQVMLAIAFKKELCQLF
jgi:hypothetical protein